jgi:nucleotide-binding universal stress UspA family protein
MFKNILFAYDGSECAQHAAKYAQELAKKFDSLVLLRHFALLRHFGDSRRPSKNQAVRPRRRRRWER